MPGHPQEPPDEALSIEPGGFELFWEEHKKAILIGAAAFLAILAAAGVFFTVQEARRSAAEKAFSAAATDEAWRKIVESYPRSIVAGHACLLLAESQRNAGKLDEASQTLRAFIAALPDHPFAPLGRLGLAEIQSLEGKTSEAANSLGALAQDEKSFVAPFALFSAAQLFLAELDKEQAKRALDRLQSEYSGSVSAQAAEPEIAALTQASGTDEAQTLPAR